MSFSRNALIFAHIHLLLAITHAAATDSRITSGLSKPESALFHEGAIYVSNIDATSAGGNSAAKDGVGWISKFDPTGKTINERWFEGLNAPKGIRAFRDNLFVADIDEVVVIGLASAQRVATIKIEGAKFLNDLTVDDSGNVFVADTLGQAIYKIETDGKTVVPLVTGMVEAPNGLYFDDGKLFVATWGQGLGAGWSTKVDGQVISIDLQSKKVDYVTKNPVGHLDGIEKLKSGNWLVSAKIESAVYVVNAKTGAATRAFKDADLTDVADIGYDPASSTVLVPNMKLNAVQILPFKE